MKYSAPISTPSRRVGKKSMNICKLFVVIVLAFTLLGCTNVSKGPQSSSVPELDGSGQLRVWIAGESRSLDVFSTFTATTGIPVQIEFGTQEELRERVLANKGNPEADLFWSDNVIDLAVLAGLGAFERYETPFATSLPGYAWSSDGLWHGLTIRQLSLVYTADSFSGPIPTTVEQLSQTDWRGELTVPSGNSRLWDTILIEIAAFEGERELREFLEMLGGVPLAFSNNPAEDVQSVADGTTAAALTTSEVALPYLAKAENFADIRIQPLGSRYTEQVHIVTGIGILRGTERKEAAEKLVDFLLTERSREDLASRLSHNTLSHGTEDALRLHPDEATKFIPLIERYWRMTLAETS